MKRRDFLKSGCLSALSFASARQFAQTPMPPAGSSVALAPQEDVPADITLRIAPISLELSPNLVISTTGYNGTSPGPILRVREGKPVTVDVINETDVPEYVHWHGLLIPPDVDGAEEEGTPVVPPHGRNRYQFTPRPAGTRWYHTHAMAGIDLHRGGYTGQYGFLMVEPANTPGNYDQELFLALRDWEPYFSRMEEHETADGDEAPGVQSPTPERPGVPDRRPNGLEVTSQTYSINDKSLGAGEPIRVRPGSRVLMHFLNASAIENRQIALPGHQFNVIALDGNPVPRPHAVEVLTIGPGERIDAVVEMNEPGNWILGSVQENIRNAGLGVIIEYANQSARQARWAAPANPAWNYMIFGNPAEPRPIPKTFELLIEKVPRGSDPFNSFLINGKSYPHEREFVLQEGTRYSLLFRNRTNDAHPLHLHRHLFELVDINGIPASGIMKDTFIIPAYGRAAVEFVADQPGLSLFHCHIQQHMDFGFKALFRYA